ncbi:High-affinity branched-chain amino acid transport system permease protein LivH [Variovorax boronicumulans]|uniref:branched-chain amino acid ABC transporter permease n=1 Tax=Variovorax boronicumulans TaxID=436515 RepID=UPI000BB325CF|nr:branched-chain amino acid ABC transporter permease [Variovorax boronicumulans]PBI87792.1 High-affinity branched-chain amino acid transport system permease protein LivH [Variovorax boronicumulans]
MQALLHQIASGLAAGGIYASLAIALVLIYRCTSSVNFAQGELAMFSTYMSWALVQAGASWWVAFAIVVAGSFILGLALDKTIFQPLRHKPVLSVIAASIALLIILNSLIGLLFGHELREFSTPFGGVLGSGEPFLSAHEAGALLVTTAELLAVFVFFRFTRFGLAMRAVAVNPSSAELAGINTNQVLAVGWGLAAVAGAVAGLMAAPIVFLEPSMMMSPLIYALAGALLGGIASPVGAVAGGFAVGVLENLLGAYVVGNDLKLTCIMLLIIATLVLRPAGIFGKATQARV